HSMAVPDCTTTQEKQIAWRNEAADPPTATAAVKDEGKKQAPARLAHALAKWKEREAEAAKEPEMQARLRDEARRSYQESLKADPDSFEAMRGLARIYAAMGDYERALETYRTALAKHPRDVSLSVDLGMMH